jgi:hypothetical protein
MSLTSRLQTRYETAYKRSVGVWLRRQALKSSI